MLYLIFVRLADAVRYICPWPRGCRAIHRTDSHGTSGLLNRCSDNEP
jgi:hypothetical protein